MRYFVVFHDNHVGEIMSLVNKYPFPDMEKGSRIDIKGETYTITGKSFSASINDVTVNYWVQRMGESE